VEIWRTVVVDGAATTWDLRNLLTYPTEANVEHWDDTGAAFADAYDIDADYLYHARPEATDMTSLIRFHGDRLMSTLPSAGGTLRFSTQHYIDFWPNSETGVYGGMYSVAPDSDPIVDMITEGGSFQTAGRVGHSLLVQTRTRSCRLFGSQFGTSDPWTLDEAFPIGSAAQTACNLFGHVYWLSPDGPMKLSVGSMTPQPIYSRLWSRGIRAAMQASAAEQADLLSAWTAVTSGEFYVISNPQDKVLYCYHVPSDTYTTLPMDEAVLGMCVWDGSQDAGQVTVAFASKLYRLWLGAGKSTVGPRGRKSISIPTGAGTAANQAVKWTTSPLPLGGAGDSRYVKIQSVRARFRKAYAAQTLTLSIYTDGDLTTVAWTGDETLAADATLSGAHDVLVWYPNGAVRGLEFSFSLTANLSYPIDCEGMEITYTLQEYRK